MVSPSHILVSDQDEFSDRPPLQLAADVTVAGSTTRIYFITLHMQARAGETEHARRTKAGQLLQAHISGDLMGQKVMVLGDFNDELLNGITSGKPSPYAAWVADTTDFEFLTLPLEQQNEGTFLPLGSTIDHLVVNRDLLPCYIAGSTARFVELIEAIPDYGSTTSDHLPVFSRFNIMNPLETGVQVSGTVPVIPTLDQNFPNPFNPATTIRYVLPVARNVNLSIYTLSGQKVVTLVQTHQPAGEHTVRWEGRNNQGGEVSSGVYFYRIEVEGASVTRKLTLVR
jgi:hypothetical protein